MSTSPWQLLQGQVVDGRYHLIEMLRSGGFGAVFRAEEVVEDRLLRQVAVKLIPPSPDLDPGRQFQEIELSVRLNHPNILTCYSAGRCNLAGSEYLFLAMELGDESLEGHISRNGRLSYSDVIEVIRQVASAIAYLHGPGGGIVHRDITPGNVLTVNGQWKLSDFGISRLLGSSGLVHSRALGRRGYVPPEGYSGQISPAWDVWSLGVLICYALTAELPFSASSDEEMMRAIIDCQPSIPSGVREPFISFIRGCLEKDERRRWTAQQVVDALERPNDIKQEGVIVSDPQVQLISLSPEVKAFAPAATWQCIRCIRSADGGSNALVFSPTGGALISRARRGPICILDVRTGQSVLTLGMDPRGRATCRSLALSRERGIMAASANFEHACLWEVGRLLNRPDSASSFRQFRTRIVQRLIDRVTRRTDAGTSVFGPASAWMYGFKVAESNTVVLRKEHGMADIDLSPDGRWLAWITTDGIIRLFSVDTGRLVWSTKNQTRHGWCISFDPSGHQLACSEGKDVRILETGTGRQAGVIKGHKAIVHSLAYGPSGSMLVSGGADNAVRVWSTSDLTQILQLGGHSGGINSVAFHPKDMTIASAGDDCIIRLWNTRTGELLSALDGHRRSVSHLDFSPDGQLLASSDIGGEIRIWQLSAECQETNQDRCQ